MTSAERKANFLRQILPNPCSPPQVGLSSSAALVRKVPPGVCWGRLFSHTPLGAILYTSSYRKAFRPPTLTPRGCGSAPTGCCSSPTSAALHMPKSQKKGSSCWGTRWPKMNRDFSRPVTSKAAVYRAINQWQLCHRSDALAFVGLCRWDDPMTHTHALALVPLPPLQLSLAMMVFKQSRAVSQPESRSLGGKVGHSPPPTRSPLRVSGR